MASGGAPGDAALRSPAAIAGNAEATGRLVGSAEELTNLSVLATGGEAGQRYDTRNTANRIWLGNGGQATAQGHAEGGGRVWVDVSERGGQGERGGDATATASARGTSPLSNVFVNSSAVSSGGRAQSSAVAELSTNQISTPVRAVATATTSGGSSGANARSTSGYTGERAMVIEATAQSSDASATAHAATGVGGLTERYDTYGPFGYSILIGMPASDQVVLTSRVAQMYADGQTPLLAQGGVGTGPAMTFGKTALSNVGLDARLKTGLADNERAFIGFLNLEQNNVDVPDAVFGTLSFSVDNHGTELFKQEFTSLEEARAYFADRPIVLESVTGDVDLGLHFSVVGALSSGWRINYVIGVIPEPSTQALMALAFGGLFVVRRWQARRSAVAAAGRLFCGCAGAAGDCEPCQPGAWPRPAVYPSLRLSPSSRHHLEAGRDLRGLAQHDAGRAVLVVRHLDGALHGCGGQVHAGDGEVHVDAGEDLGLGGGALAGELDLAAAHVVAAALEDEHHVVGGAAAGAGQQQLHRARSQVAAAAVWGAVHGQQVAAAGFGREGHAVGRHPVDRAIHEGLGE